MSKKIYLVDWNSFIYRMFFALPEFSTKDGKVVNAIFGMAKFFVNQLKKENPDYLIFIKDARWRNFRHKLYAEYKATRDKMPDNLRDQISDIENMIKMMWVDIVEIPWFEADDVIWTLATKYCWHIDYKVDILTWDKDLYSLVSDNIKIYDTMKKKKFWPSETKEKFEIEPQMITDYLAIVWDKSDNIPWIEWFWPKKAVALINAIWWVEEIYEYLDKLLTSPTTPLFVEDGNKEIKKIFSGKTLDKLVSGRENAFLSKKLATLEKNIKLEDFNLDNFIFYENKLINSEIIDLFKKFEFNSLIPDNEVKKLKTWNDLWLKVKIVWNKEELDNLKKEIKKNDKLVLDTESTSLNIMKAELVWISMYLDDEHIYYINRLHTWKSVTDNELYSFLDFLLTSDKLIIWHNIKYDLEILELFMKNKYIKIEKIFWQMSLGV